MVIGLIFKIISYFKGKTVLETKCINENIYAVQCGYVNFYIYHKNSNFICFDSGFGTKTIEKELQKININALFIKSLFLTHSDYDHFNGVKLFSNAQVYISREEVKMLNGGKHRPYGLSKKSKELRTMELLDIDQTIQIDDISVKCILTPGHTYGSMTYLVDDKYLFLGDSCNIENGKIVPLKPYINMNQELSIKTVENIKSIKDISMYFVGHSGLLENMVGF